ncbi:tRNA(Met) cytidine acetyltransferase TmcA [Thiocystis violacea]|uniref:tRNA(Met) cytidine acetyltransferase TmcA n=1 Tax=Thiocystis violacea TaxID=13725 RepID=UPI0019064C6F|nr:GNAT family N-acetyltransferase [Thiocystis violacea]MBK1721970.1 GNAT family N-acetyltransferase [Thiocystis violacea]
MTQASADDPSPWSPVADAALTERLTALHRRALAANHRVAIRLSGTPDWTHAAATSICRLFPLRQPVWLTDRALAADALPLRSAHKLLGRDLDLLLYDAHSGFDPDGFGAATGAIVGGGLLVLLTPPLATWPALPDPQAERIAVWPHRSRDVSGHFLERLTRVLQEDPHLIQIDQGQRGLPPLPAAATTATAAGRPSRALAHACTPDQQRALAAVLKTARGRARRPLVLKAHRGRGKSAALGLAAGQLLSTGARRILVTAPSQAAVESLFRHARAVLASGEGAPLAPERAHHLSFLPPGQLVSERPPADLLLVDEAAGIPAPLLESMLAHYGRIVFATTVHGYEGTGRGFDIRFRDRLDRLTPDWRALELEQPIRWADGDPLEALCFRALLLDAAPAPDDQVAAATPLNCACERIDPARLARDDETLRQLFGLLTLAHYQTRPMDLRMLLDGPNVRILVLRHAGSVVATLLAAAEGGFDDADLRNAIYRGQRRPRGHLLPQTLSAHAGIHGAPTLRYLRVIRIAVHPAAQGRGLGRRLLDALRQKALAEGLDCTGASFGATPGLIDFWQRCGHVPVHIGSSRNAASGEHAVVVLQGTTQAGQRLIAGAQRRLEAALTVLLPGPLRALEPGIALAISALLPVHEAPEPNAPEADRELRCFVAGHRALEPSLPLLADLSRRHLAEALARGLIAVEDAQVLMAAARQLRPIGELARAFERRGRDDVLSWLRQAARGLQSVRESRADHLDEVASAV